MTFHRTISVSKATAVVVAVLLSFVAVTPAAGAHAALVTTDPPNGAHLDTPIDEVVFTFNESVQARSFVLVDADGNRTELAPSGGDVMRAPVDTSEGGWFALSWSVVSADGHSIGGAITFRVGAGDDATPDDLASLTDGGTGPTGPWEMLRVLGRSLAILGAIVAIGTAFLRRWALGPDLDGALAPVRTLAAAAAILSVLGSATAFGAAVGGDSVIWPGSAADLVIGVGALSTLAWSARRREDSTMAGIVAIVGLFSLALIGLSGHVAADGRPLARMALAAHLVAATVWLGATPALALALRSGAGWRVLRRFSTTATATIGVVVVAGGVVTWSLSDGWASLTSTAWGRLLIIKALLVGLALALGAGNRRRVRNERDLRGTGRLVAFEALVLVGVLIFTAGLARSSPRYDDGPDRSARSVSVAMGDLTARVEIGEEIDASREIRVTFVDAGNVVVDVAEPTLELSAEDLGVAAIPQDLEAVDTGRYRTVTADLRLRGAWTVHLSAKPDRFRIEDGEVTLDL
ncbi:MAG TPA: copper resistance protein CopC [Microthrixaceae bacterium]|nr:copper resistance protein CopC [Microthrixaceae bacterium]